MDAPVDSCTNPLKNFASGTSKPFKFLNNCLLIKKKMLYHCFNFFTLVYNRVKMRLQLYNIHIYKIQFKRVNSVNQRSEFKNSNYYKYLITTTRISNKKRIKSLKQALNNSEIPLFLVKPFLTLNLNRLQPPIDAFSPNRFQTCLRKN